MAILWQHTKGRQHYEVRSAGSTTRLYTNGVFHSQWNPRHVLSDALWDLLLLPAFMVPSAPNRVLVLGVGGGAVVRQLRALFQPRELIGVELDPVHLRIAKDWFDVPATAPHLKLSSRAKESMVCSDARKWLRAYRGPAFDYIVDDLFGHENGVASRAIEVDDAWASLLLSHLKPGGVLVANFADSREFCNAAKALNTAVAGSMVYGLLHPRYDNKIGVVTTSERGPKYWKSAVLNCERLTALQKRVACAYKWRLYRNPSGS